MSQARSYANIQAQADRTAAKAEELADRPLAAAARISSSWHRLDPTDQDSSVKQMNENNISFGDLVAALAARNGAPTVEIGSALTRSTRCSTVTPLPLLRPLAGTPLTPH